MSKPTVTFGSSDWLESSAINPKTGQKWMPGDELGCSCGQSIRVGTSGFAGLRFHRSSAKHHKKLKRKIQLAVASKDAEDRLAAAQERLAAATDKLARFAGPSTSKSRHGEDVLDLKIRQMMKDAAKKRRSSTSALDSKIARKENRSSLGGHASSHKKYSLTKESVTKSARALADNRVSHI